MATTPDKDTIYIDIDDEITGIINKLTTSDNKLVALVLPKRASAFQSIVNMKLLKRAADGAKKNLVLITNEASLLPLAGAAGVYVAKTLTSKPVIPVGPDAVVEDDEAIDEDAIDGDTPVDPDKTVGELSAKPTGDEVETLVMDDEDVPPEDLPGPKSFDPPPKGKNKKLAVPNFERFRLLLVVGGLGLLLLIGGFIFATIALPKAVITIKTDATKVDTNTSLNLSTTAKDLNPEDGTIPAKLATQQKVYTQQVTTTGQKNNGNKASGTVALTNCSKSVGEILVPAGTGLSSGGNTYITQEPVTLPESTFNGANKCNTSSKPSVDVLAQSGGTSYNLPAGATFAVAGFASVSGSGSSISGGTDAIVQSVNQNDVNNAKAKIVPNEAEIKKALIDSLKKDNLYPIEATYVAGTAVFNNSANVGEVANSLTVTETITYTMFGVKKSDLTTLVENSVKSQIDTEKQSILDNGLGSAGFNVDTISATEAKLTVSAVATAGPDLNIDSIKADSAGQKPGAIKDKLTRNPDVVSVDVKLSPFWVSSVPKKTDRITVEIAKPTTSAKASSTDANNP